MHHLSECALRVPHVLGLAPVASCLPWLVCSCLQSPGQQQQSGGVAAPAPAAPTSSLPLYKMVPALRSACKLMDRLLVPAPQPPQQQQQLGGQALGASTPAGHASQGLPAEAHVAAFELSLAVLRLIKVIKGWGATLRHLHRTRRIPGRFRLQADGGTWPSSSASSVLCSYLASWSIPWWLRT